jgi:hypothetical protein
MQPCDTAESLPGDGGIAVLSFSTINRSLNVGLAEQNVRVAGLIQWTPASQVFPAKLLGERTERQIGVIGGDGHFGIAY